MNNIKKVLNLSQKGNKSAQEMLKLTALELVLADMHLQIAYRMQKLAGFLKINCRNESKAIGAILNNAKKIDRKFCKDLGVDELAEGWGDRAEAVQKVLKEIIFLDIDSLLKIESTAKILQKKEWNQRSNAQDADAAVEK